MPNPFRVFFLAAFIVLPTAFFAQSTSATPARPEQSPQQAYVIQQRSTKMRFEEDSSSVRTERQTTLIQNEAGLKHFGILTFTYIEGHEFSLDTVEVHKKEGSVVKAGPEQVQEVTPEVSRVAPMYSDIRQKAVTVPGLAVGDELTFQYTIKAKPLVPGQFWFNYSFLKDEIVRSETLDIDVPKSKTLKVWSAPEYKQETQTHGDRTIYSWHSENSEFADSPELKFQRIRQQTTGTFPPPSVVVSTFKSWDEVAAWYYSLEKGRAVATDAVKAKALELTRDAKTPEEKARALYKYVSLNFRYISLDFGIGHYQPHAADQVLSNSYGDCKDKHTLLAAMLQAVGITAYPVLMNSAHQVETSVPSPEQFDHLITAIPSEKGLVFLDTTAEVAPYGLLLLPLRNKSALVVTGPGSGKFVVTPEQPPFKEVEESTLQGKLDESGTLEADLSWFIHGDLEIIMKEAFRRAGPDKYQEMVQGFSYRIGFGGEVSKVEISGLQDTESGFRMKYHYHRPNYFDLTEEQPKNVLPFGFSGFPEMDAKQKSLRLYAAGGELHYKCRVELPEGFTAQVPMPMKLERDYLKYESSYSTEKNVIAGERTFRITTAEIQEEHRLDYNAFVHSLRTDEGQTVRLQIPPGFVAKAGASNASMDEIFQRAEIETHEHDYNAALSDYRKVAQQDPKRKGIWTKIALVETYQNRTLDAARDFRKAIEADPFDAQAHAELGGVLLGGPRSAEGEAELKRAAEIDPLNHRAYYNLGWYYSERKKDYGAAIPVLEKALNTDEEHFHDSQQIMDMLSQAYFHNHEMEKGVALIKRNVESAPNPNVWNAAAYTLAENDADLELAKQYANSALKSLYERLNKVDESGIRRTDLALVNQLAATWDTMGWVSFKQGDTASAEKYVRAAWVLSQATEIGEHLGEIYEKLGRMPDAHRYYAMSARSFETNQATPSGRSRQRLNRLVGKASADALINRHAYDTTQSRTLDLGKLAPANSKGEFYFIFEPGEKLNVKAVSGDEALQAALQKNAAKIIPSVIFPDDGDLKVIRQGIVMCRQYNQKCELVFLTSDSALSGR